MYQIFSFSRFSDCLHFEINGMTNERRLSLASPRTHNLAYFRPLKMAAAHSKLHFYSPFARRLYSWLCSVRLSCRFVYCPSFSLVYLVIDFKTNRYKIVFRATFSKVVTQFDVSIRGDRKWSKFRLKLRDPGGFLECVCAVTLLCSETSRCKQCGWVILILISLLWVFPLASVSLP